jgi:hypothetical protein
MILRTTAAGIAWLSRLSASLAILAYSYFGMGYSPLLRWFIRLREAIIRMPLV